MCLFKKNKISEKTLSDRELIESNSKSIESLIVLAADNTLLISEFAAIKEKTKSNGQPDNKTNELITDLKLVIADRKQVNIMQASGLSINYRVSLAHFDKVFIHRSLRAR